MYLFTLDVTPGPDAIVSDPDNDNADKAIGACVSCYIDFKELDGARQLAQFYITQAGWVVGNEVEAPVIIEQGAYGDDDENQPFFLEAQEGGYSLIFNCWSSDDDE